MTDDHARVQARGAEGIRSMTMLTQRSTRYAWWVIAVLLLAYTVSFVDRMILSLLVPSVRAAFDISDTQVSLLVGFSFALFYTLMGLPLATLADRGNRRALIACGIAFWSVMTAACGAAASYGALFLARVGVGIGEAALAPAAYSLIGDYFPKDKLGRAIAVYSIGVPLGSGIALVIGGYVINLVNELGPTALPLLGTVEPWRLTFFMVGLPGLLVALLMLTVREPERRDVGDATRPTWAHLARFVAERRAVFGPHFAGLSLLTFVIYGFMAWVPTFFARSHGLDPADVGLFYGVITAVAGAGGLLLGGELADRMFRRGILDGHLRTVRIATLGAAPFLITSPLVPSVVGAAALLGIGMLIASMHGGVAGAALQIIAPNRLRGQITALYFFVANLIGLGLGPTAVALITDFAFGDDAALQYSLALVAVAVLPISALILTTGFEGYRAAASRALMLDVNATRGAERGQ